MTSQQKNPSVSRRKSDNEYHIQIWQKLKSEFGEIVREPVPQKLLDLLEQLDSQD